MLEGARVADTPDIPHTRETADTRETPRTPDRTPDRVPTPDGTHARGPAPAPRFAYPVSLDLAGRRAVVVGEAAVADGKADALLAAGATLTVVAEGPAGALDRLEAAGATVARRGFAPSDLEGATVCVATSADPERRAAIFAAGHARGVLMNLVDDKDHCDFAVPAVVRRGELAIAISTAGRTPALASRLRRLLEDRFGPEWEDLAGLLGEVRERTFPLLPDFGERARRWREALHGDRLEELADLVRSGRADHARERLLDQLARQPEAVE
jgi:precorrin-2 dehydrogenase / sirohydrochlorin ferrochelatase